MNTIREEIEAKINEYINSSYEITDGYTIPTKQDLSFGTKAKKVWARVLYIDIRNSKDLLSDTTKLFAAKAHKAFLYVASKCVRSEGGDIRSFNGDSLLAFFAGNDDSIAQNAVKAAMKTSYAISKIVNPSLKNAINIELDYGIGIAQGEIFVVKSGITGEEMHQDLIWIGWPTYHAFEYGNRASGPYHLWISKNIYGSIKENNEYVYCKGTNMWVSANESFSFGQTDVFKTSYWWTI